MYFRKVLILDNYDSFTYNLVHIVEQYSDVKVQRNDEVLIEEVEKFDAVIISPGPGLPKNSGIVLNLIHHYKNTKPIFGVCLGCQAIAEYFGCKLFNLGSVKHGVDVKIRIFNEAKIFKGIPKTFFAGLYHSWAINESTVISNLEIVAKSQEGIIMAIKHSTLPIYGIQFHPESIMTSFGKQIIKNFLVS